MHMPETSLTLNIFTYNRKDRERKCSHFEAQVWRRIILRTGVGVGNLEGREKSSGVKGEWYAEATDRGRCSGKLSRMEPERVGAGAAAIPCDS